MGYESKNYRLWLKSSYQSIYNEYDGGAYQDANFLGMNPSVAEEHHHRDIHWSHDVSFWQYLLAYNYHWSDITNDDGFSSRRVTHRHAGYFHNNLVFEQIRGSLGVDFFTEELIITNDSSTNHNVGLYVEVARDTGRYINFSVGARYDIYQDYENRWSYRASVAGLYRDFKVRASYGRAVRSPTLVELEFATTSLRQQIGDLFDVGLTYWNKEWDLLVDVTYFNNDIKDEIGWNRLAGAFGDYVNADYRAMGVEVSMRYSPIDLVSLGANYTYTGADSPYTNHQAVGRPEHQANLNLNISPLRKKMNINLNLAYVGETYSFNDNRVGDYVKLDLSFSYQIHPWLTPYLRVENLLNRDYETIEGYSEPGLSAYGGFRFRY